MTDIYSSPTHLVGGTPGQITSSGKVAGLQPKGSIWIDKGQQPDGSWFYWRKGYAPPADPAPSPAPPASTVLIARNTKGEAFIQNELLTIGINASGGLGTQQAPPLLSPVAVRTDHAHGFMRVGFLPRDGADVILPGRTIEGFAVSYGDRAYANMELTGFAQIPGALLDDASWSGSTVDGLRIEQRVRLGGGSVVFDVTLTNRGAKALTGLRYMRAADPDMGDVFATTNIIGPIGTVTATLGDRSRFALGSDDPRAFAAYGGFVTADPRVIVRMSAGVAKQADVTLQLVFEIGTLAVGDTTTISLFERIG